MLVIDALDEVAVAGSGPAHHNPVLSLIREHFSTLPTTIRFMFTSRLEPHIKMSLDTAIQPLQIQPEDPRHMKDLQALIRHELTRRLEGSGGGGGGGGVHEPTEGEISEAVQLLLSKSEGRFVYLAR